jgi:hypothetical protein
MKTAEGSMTGSKDNRETVGLIFVTGRDPEFIGEPARPAVCPGPTMRWATSARQSPRFTVGQVSPIEHLEEEIAARWGDAGDTVRARSMGIRG